jgi:hypothetical protein
MTSTTRELRLTRDQRRSLAYGRAIAEKLLEDPSVAGPVRLTGINNSSTDSRPTSDGSLSTKNLGPLPTHLLDPRRRGRLIESTFATVRLRTRVTKGPGSRAAGVAMAFKLIESAQTRWRMVNAPHLVALVRAGATFVNGKLVERPNDQDQQGGDQQAA